MLCGGSPCTRRLDDWVDARTWWEAEVPGRCPAAKHVLASARVAALQRRPPTVAAPAPASLSARSTPPPSARLPPWGRCPQDPPDETQHDCVSAVFLAQEATAEAAAERQQIEQDLAALTLRMQTDAGTLQHQG